MALQKIEPIITKDPSDPVEVQAWLAAHPLNTITTVFVYGHIFYIIYM